MYNQSCADKMTTWTRVHTENLIKLHQEYPNLYNCQHRDYQNRMKRIESLNEIKERINPIRADTTLKDIKMKVKTLRTQYLRERAKLHSAKKSGEDFRSKLWCFHELQYLGESNDPNSRRSNAWFPLEDAVSIHSGDGDSMSAGNTVLFATDIHKQSSGERADGAANRSTQTLCKTSTGESIIDPFLQHLKVELLMLSGGMLQDTKWKILDIVREAQRQEKQQRLDEFNDTEWQE